MNDFDRLAPMMRDVVMAVDETKEQIKAGTSSFAGRIAFDSEQT